LILPRSHQPGGESGEISGWRLTEIDDAQGRQLDTQSLAEILAGGTTVGLFETAEFIGGCRVHRCPPNVEHAQLVEGSVVHPG